MNDYDVIVIGAGPAGENVADVADVAHGGGLRVLVVEKELVGGECSYWGCMPSKALLRPGDVISAARRTPGADAAVTEEIDVEEALARRDAIAAHWDDAGQVKWLEGIGVHFVRGKARLLGERLIEVKDTDGAVSEYRASKAVVIATGTVAAVPPIPRLREIRSWDNRDITTAKEVPARLLILGGGAIGVEMAQAWRALGSEAVTIIEAKDHLLAREEPFAGQELAVQLEREGITVLTNTKMTRAEREAEDAPVVVTVATQSGEQTLIGDELVVAVGRRAATSDLGLETVGLQPGRFIEVDDHLVAKDVPGRWLYAVGDVNGRALLTHAGKYQARIAGAYIAGLTAIRAIGDSKALPRVVFTHPQIAATGLTTAQARDAGISVEVVDFDLGRIPAASTLGRGYRGTWRLVIDGDRRVIVGATFVGPMAGEAIHAATVAIVGEVTLDRLWHAIPSFPTLSEIWLRLLEAYRDQHHAVFV